MNVLLASSEVHPYSKTGGLADMVGALGKALSHAGHRVGIVTPLYLGIRGRFPGLQRLELPLDFPLGRRQVQGEVWALEVQAGHTIYFIDQPEFFQRSGLYQTEGMDYSDNAERFIFFSKAISYLAVKLDWQPDVLHLNDWQTGMAALFLHHERRQTPSQLTPGTCFTVHNLAYQGVFPASQYVLTNLPWDYFNPAGVEFYGQVNCAKAGIAFSEVITTVSPRYAREITTPELGSGLDGLLRERQTALLGILNGVDYEEWDPAIDASLEHKYDINDLTGKQAEKVALQKEFGLTPDPGLPLFGNIGRMVEQKGVDILLGALEEMLRADIQFVQLGTGTPFFQRACQELGLRFPGRAGVRVGFDEPLSHRIEAGCDFFLMPSRFEPCGLNQMYSLRYGTIPVVRATGGLDDTVTDIREDQAKASGIKFYEYSGRALAKGIQKAIALYREPELLRHFRQNAMAADFSWDRTALEYVKVYKRIVQLQLQPIKATPEAGKSG